MFSFSTENMPYKTLYKGFLYRYIASVALGVVPPPLLPPMHYPPRGLPPPPPPSSLLGVRSTEFAIALQNDIPNYSKNILTYTSSIRGFKSL